MFEVFVYNSFELHDLSLGLFHAMIYTMRFTCSLCIHSSTCGCESVTAKRRPPLQWPWKFNRSHEDIQWLRAIIVSVIQVRASNCTVEMSLISTSNAFLVVYGIYLAAAYFSIEAFGICRLVLLPIDHDVQSTDKSGWKRNQRVLIDCIEKWVTDVN